MTNRALLSGTLRSAGESFGPGEEGPLSGAAVPLGLTSLGMAFSAAAFAGGLFEEDGWGVAGLMGSFGVAGTGDGPVREGCEAGLICC